MSDVLSCSKCGKEFKSMPNEESLYESKTCRNCQHYKTLNLGRERYCHVWGRKSPMVFDRFFCGWWEKRKEQQGVSKE